MYCGSKYVNAEATDAEVTVRQSRKMSLTYVRYGLILRDMKTPNELTPLTPAVFHNLLSLASGDKHGHEIMKQVKQDSRGNVKMGNGTLYGSIKRMLADGLMADAGDKVDPSGDDERRHYYQLTDLGRQALNSEMQRYHDLVTLIHQRGLL